MKITFKNFAVHIIGVFICLLIASPLIASKASIKIMVEVIKASKDSNKVDAELKYLVKEISPVLNFTSFALLKKSEVRIAQKGVEEITLPAGRILDIQFLSFEEQHARVQVRILEKKTETFRTVLLLVDEGSVFIGGPPHEGGALLLRIRAEF